MCLPNLVSGSLHMPVNMYVYSARSQRHVQRFKMCTQPKCHHTHRPDWKHLGREPRICLPSLGCPQPAAHYNFTHSHTYFLFFYHTCALKEFKGFTKKEFVNTASLTAASWVHYGRGVFITIYNQKACLCICHLSESGHRAIPWGLP